MKNVEEKVLEFEDQWKRLDRLVEEMKEGEKPVPPANSFTAEEYATQKKISEGQARKVLHNLVSKGRLKAIKVGLKNYYTFPK